MSHFYAVCVCAKLFEHEIIVLCTHVISHRHSKFWRLDLKEDSLRQRLQFLPNPTGSVHESAIRSIDPADEDKPPPPAGGGAATEEELAGLPGSVGAALSNAEIVSLSSDDFGESSLSTAGLELPLEQLDKSEQLLTIQCSMVILAHAIPGTLAFTRTYLTFTADDSTEEYEKASYLVCLKKVAQCSYHRSIHMSVASL